ncbi:MAG: 3-oxoacyl-[acyl-carrier-protein] reductase [Gemmatimonadota bacterium]
MRLDLTGKIAFVTGGTRGIGRAIAESLHAAGASVALTGRSEAAAEAVAREIGDRARGFGCDLLEPATVRTAVAAAESALGPIDILVNNAGLTRDNLMLRMSSDDWNDVIAANLSGAFHTTQPLLKGMMKRRSGRIINITSVVGLVGNGGQANYAASKAGLIGFTKSLAKEYGGRGILVNCVAPGFIETDMTAALPDGARTALLESIPLARLGRPEDVAGAVLYLASDLGAYVTGQVLVVDGGMTG